MYYKSEGLAISAGALLYKVGDTVYLDEQSLIEQGKADLVPFAHETFKVNNMSTSKHIDANGNALYKCIIAITFSDYRWLWASLESIYKKDLILESVL